MTLDFSDNLLFRIFYLFCERVGDHLFWKYDFPQVLGYDYLYRSLTYLHLDDFSGYYKVLRPDGDEIYSFLEVGEVELKADSFHLSVV